MLCMLPPDRLKKQEKLFRGELMLFHVNLHLCFYVFLCVWWTGDHHFGRKKDA